MTMCEIHGIGFSDRLDICPLCKKEMDMYEWQIERICGEKRSVVASGFRTETEAKRFRAANCYCDPYSDVDYIIRQIPKE